MRKRKLPQNNPNRSLNDFLAGYNSVTLIGLIETFENGDAWNIFRAYLKLRQREFEVASLDLVSKGQTHPAAHASGYAQGIEDVADKLMGEMKKFVLNESPVVESPRPEEEVEA